MRCYCFLKSIAKYSIIDQTKITVEKVPKYFEVDENKNNY